MSNQKRNALTAVFSIDTKVLIQGQDFTVGTLFHHSNQIRIGQGHGYIRIWIGVYRMRNGLRFGDGRLIPGSKPKRRLSGSLRRAYAGRVDYKVMDGTIERDLALQQHEDGEAMRDMARYARRVRKRLGLTQLEFARRINVPQETIRNWEQGKRRPTGAARTLLKVLDKAPETALRVLT